MRLFWCRCAACMPSVLILVLHSVGYTLRVGVPFASNRFALSLCASRVCVYIISILNFYGSCSRLFSPHTEREKEKFSHETIEKRSTEYEKCISKTETTKSVYFFPCCCLLGRWLDFQILAVTDRRACLTFFSTFQAIFDNFFREFFIKQLRGFSFSSLNVSPAMTDSLGNF